MKHPYRVTFKLPSDGPLTLCTTILAETANDAKASIRKAYCAPGNEVTTLSARKVRLSFCASYKKFGKKAAEKYFGRTA